MLKTRLESTPTLRRRLDELKGTWDLLEVLEDPQPDDNLTRSTLTQVVLDAEEEVRQRRRGPWLRSIVFGVVLLAVCLAGFAAVWFSPANPDRMIMIHLPTLVHFDSLKQVDNLEFLRRLEQKNLFPAATPTEITAVDNFAKDETVATTPTLPAALLESWYGEGWLARLGQIQKTTPSQRALLWQNWQRFGRLPIAERIRIHHLVESLSESSDREKLAELANRYTAWIKQLPTYTQFELREIPMEARLARIDRLRLEQQEREAIQRWLLAVADGFRQELPPELQKHWENFSPQLGDPQLFRILAMHFRRRFHQQERVTNAQELLAQLRKELPVETATALAALTTKKQWQWVLKRLAKEASEKAIESRLAGPAAAVSDETLTQFFDTLPENQRDLLLQMPSQSFYQKLRWLYDAEQEEKRRPPRPRRGMGPGWEGDREWGRRGGLLLRHRASWTKSPIPNWTNRQTLPVMSRDEKNAVVEIETWIEFHLKTKKPEVNLQNNPGCVY